MKTKEHIAGLASEQDQFIILNGNDWPNGFRSIYGEGIESITSNTDDLREGEWLGSIAYQNHKGPGPVNFYKPIKTNTFSPSELTDGAFKPIGVSPKPGLLKEEYIDKIKTIQEDILNGSYYEINFCIPFEVQLDTHINPFEVYLRLNQISPTPFSCFMKWKNTFLLGASPERFLTRNNGYLYSQPIKGTVSRDSDPQKDLLLKQSLTSSDKEKAENLMIVDLVRNDLTKCSELGSVEVEKLFKVDSYAQVHQLSSIIKSKSDQGLKQILEATFPMGSMTGAPKPKVIQRIHELEQFDRKLFSGSVGWYEGSNGNFDFNVNIRSIYYNDQTNVLSFAVGSAITLLADPEAEWDECLLKAKAIFEAIG